MINMDPGLRDHLLGTPGSCSLELVLEGAPERAVAAMGTIVAAVREVRHPEEPTESFVSYASSPEASADGATVFLDTADLDAYEEVADEIVTAIGHACDRIAGDGVLRPAE